MSKLEEQLRKSRKQERSDLQPPAGGWEAIQASLAATAAGAGAAASAAEGGAAAGGALGAAGTSAAAGTKASLLATALKALLGLCVVGGLAAGVWATSGSDDPPEVEGSAESIAVAPTTTDEASVSNASTINVDPTAINDAGVTPLRQEYQPGKVVGTATTPATENSEPRTVNQAKETASSEVTEPPTNPELQAPAATKEAGPPMPSASAGNVRPNTGNPTAASAVEPVADAAELSSPAGEVASSERSAAAPLPGAGEEATINALDATPAIGFSEVPTPISSLGSTMIEPLERVPIDHVPNLSGIEFTGFESLAFFGEESEEDNKFRKFKRPAIAEWQYHLSTSLHLSRRQFSFGGSPILERVPTGTGTERFSLPNGEIVDANFINFNSGGEFTEEDNVLVRGGVTRQTKWGGTFRGGLGLFQGTRETGALPEALAENQVGLVFKEKSNAAFLELGFHYTFLRRKRFRPYVGVEALSFLFYNVNRRETFFDQQTGLESTRADFTIREATLPFSLDYAVTLGFQYRFSSRLSAGAFAWSNYGYDIYALAPLGLEVRYSFQ